MKNCTACNEQIALEVNFCPNCGEKQQVKEVSKVEEIPKFEAVTTVSEVLSASSKSERFPAVFVVASVLAIAFCATVLLITFWYIFFGSMFDSLSTQIVGIVWGITIISSIIGAIMIIRKKLKGLYLYTISQVIFIIAAIVEVILLYNNPKTEGFAVFISIILFIPSITFLILFWVSKLRKHLQ